MFRVNPYISDTFSDPSTNYTHTDLPNISTPLKNLDILSHYPSLFNISDSQTQLLKSPALEEVYEEIGQMTGAENIFYSSETTHKENISLLSGIEDMLENQLYTKPTEYTQTDNYESQIKQLKNDVLRTQNQITELTMINKSLCSQLQDQHNTIKALELYCKDLNSKLHKQISELDSKYPPISSSKRSKQSCCNVI
jgi:chromosome segregation ATPase